MKLFNLFTFIIFFTIGLKYEDEIKYNSRMRRRSQEFQTTSLFRDHPSSPDNFHTVPNSFTADKQTRGVQWLSGQQLNY